MRDRSIRRAPNCNAGGSLIVSVAVFSMRNGNDNDNDRRLTITLKLIILQQGIMRSDLCMRMWGKGSLGGEVRQKQNTCTRRVAFCFCLVKCDRAKDNRARERERASKMKLSNRRRQRLRDGGVNGCKSLSRSLVISLNTCGLSTAAKMPKSMGNSANFCGSYVKIKLNYINIYNHNDNTILTVIIIIIKTIIILQ